MEQTGTSARVAVRRREPAGCADSRLAATRSRELHVLVHADHLHAGQLHAGRAPIRLNDAQQAGNLRGLALPEGLSHIVPGRQPVSLARRKPRVAALTLEGVVAHGSQRLLVTVPQVLRVRWNAAAAPPVLLACVGDQLRLPDGTLLYVTEYRRADVGSPPHDVVGRPCGVCRLPLAAETTILFCRCGVPMHLEGDERPAGERLGCALDAGECPVCGRALEPGGAYTWLPTGGKVIDV